MLQPYGVTLPGGSTAVVVLAHVCTSLDVCTAQQMVHLYSCISARIQGARRGMVYGSLRCPGSIHWQTYAARLSLGALSLTQL